MAIDLATSRDDLDAQDFRRDRFVLSGDAAADKVYGYRGIVAETNHGYAHRTQTFASAREYDDTALFTTSSTSYVDATGTLAIEIGADVAKIQVVADLKHDGTFGGSGARLKMVTSDATADPETTVTTGSTREQQTAQMTLTDATGQVITIKLQLKVNTGGGNAELYSYVIQEVPMVSGDFP